MPRPRQPSSTAIPIEAPRRGTRIEPSDGSGRMNASSCPTTDPVDLRDEMQVHLVRRLELRAEPGHDRTRARDAVLGRVERRVMARHARRRCRRSDATSSGVVARIRASGRRRSRQDGWLSICARWSRPL